MPKLDQQFLHFMRLWDKYSPLLTPTQQEITNLYFNCDLSLAEIAEEKGVSKQSVSDCLQKCRKQLEEYEEKLKYNRTVVELCTELSFLRTDLMRWAEGIPEEYRTEILKILHRDYEEEIKKTVEANAETLL